MKNQRNLNCISVIKKRLINAEVVDIKIGYSTMIIVCNEGNYYYIDFRNSEVFIDNKSYKIDNQDIESKVCLARLYKNKITSLEIDDYANLTIEFDQNAKRVVTKSAKEFEAWEMDGPNHFKIVCALGGELVCWYGE